MIHIHPKEIRLLERLLSSGKLAEWPYALTPDILLAGAQSARRDAATFLRSYRRIPKAQRTSLEQSRANEISRSNRAAHLSLMRLENALSPR